MPQFSSSKQYQSLAEDIQKIIKNTSVAERVETKADRTANIIEVTGDFEIFDFTEIEYWRARLKFEIRDIEPKDEEEWEMREMVAMYAPELAVLMTAKSTVIVSKQEQDEWTDITEEFIKRCSHDLRWRKE